jgi:hypothetical protein
MNTPGVVLARPPATLIGAPQLASASTRNIAQSIAANGNFQLPGKGQQFYFDVASATLQVRVTVNGNVGAWTNYAQGTGLNIAEYDPNAVYDNIEIQNPNAFPVIFSIRCGFQGFIDRRSILQVGQIQQVAYPTSPTAGGTARIDIPDLSGTQFLDINGTAWLAINRLAIVLTNYDNTSNYLLQAAGALTNNGPSITGSLAAKPPLFVPVSGHFSIYNGGAAMNLTVSEIYNAISPSLA